MLNSNMSPDESPWDENPHVQKPNSTSGKSALDYLGLTTDYLSIPLCAGAILANLLLITVILKYKRLKNRTNFYMLNFAVFHTCYIISTPLFYIVLDLFYNSELEVHWYCVWIRVENFAIGLILTFVGGFGIDAFFEKIRPSWFGKYERRYLYLFSFFYFSHFLMYVTAASVCLKTGFSNNFSFYFLTTYYFVILISVLYVNYKEKKMETNFKLSTPNKAYALNISVIILLCWIPLFIFYNLMNIFKNIQKVEHILWYTAFLPEYLAYCCSIIIVCKLWKSSKHFRAAFRKVFRRPVLDSEYDELNVNENGEEISKPL
ncbi:hypothetical protein NQ314_002802 [Rhamnusium bicolor]|uniref:G-protein coupled receptors family 1 profile domain-containing protein n=1 Tax=Rhamnusium bicolor TaxID=1586634 RepID=A0AAV8ZNN1_9CUCU|nr:hypothetical protein NQ314_002802 [Rhamnusium bicolor]